MGLQRVGVVLFGVGLMLATLAAVVFGLGCTEVACPDAPPLFVPTGVDLVTGAISFFDGCNSCTTGPGVGHGLGLILVGTVVGSVGAMRELAQRD